MTKKLALLSLLVALGLSLRTMGGEELDDRSSRRGVIHLESLLLSYSRREELLTSVSSVGSRADKAACDHRAKLRSIFLADVALSTRFYGRRYNYETIQAARLGELEGSVDSLLASDRVPAGGLYYYSLTRDVSTGVSKAMNLPQFLRESRAKRPIPAAPPAAPR